MEKTKSSSRQKRFAEDSVPMPQKKNFRQRAHANPLSDVVYEHPDTPNSVDWEGMFPIIKEEGWNGAQRAEIADVGCGYGGLLVALARDFPQKLILGMEIRDKVTAFVQQRIESLRSQPEGGYKNAAVVRANAMQHISHWIGQAQLSHLFFCFPDPHFKKSKHRWRIISRGLLDDYAFMVRPGGGLYTISDVEEVHEWMEKHCTEHPLFRPFTEKEMKEDPIIPLMRVETEEGKKVARNKGLKLLACFKRL